MALGALLPHSIQRFVVQTGLILSEAFGIKTGLHIEEAESPTECVVNHGKAAVSSVHHANDIQVFRHRERKPVVGKRGLGTTIVPLNKHQEFAEYFAHIATIDFIDDKEEVLIRLVSGPLSNEGVSLLENTAHLGLPIPEKLKDILSQLHGREEVKEDENHE